MKKVKVESEKLKMEMSQMERVPTYKKFFTF